MGNDRYERLVNDKDEEEEEEEEIKIVQRSKKEEIRRNSNDVQQIIFQLQTHSSQFKRLVDQLGTGKDTKEQRARLHKLRDQIGSNAKQASILVKAVAKAVTEVVREEQVRGGLAGDGDDDEYDDDDAESLAERQKKLVKDLHATLKDFQRAQRACAERESTFLPQKESALTQQKKKGYGATTSGGVANTVAVESERGGQFYQQQMVDERQQHAPLLMEHKSAQREMSAVEIDMRFNDQLIEERERGIAEIQQQIGEVNEIFQDLAVLVNEQGNMIDDIEANIVSTAVRTKEAQKELTKADKSQKSARNKMVCLAITVFTALIILILFLLQ